MRVKGSRHAAVLLALTAFLLPPTAVTAASALNVPQAVTAGVVSGVTLKVAASVAALDGRILVDPNAAQLIGVAPVRGGTALTPVANDDGYSFAAYDLKPKNKAVTLRLVMLPKVTGTIDFRILIDDAADKNGTRLTLPTTDAASSLRVSGPSSHYTAPNGVARAAAAHAVTAVKPVLGHTTVTTDNIDVVRAGWYAAHEGSAVCGSASNTDADANGDGCIDAVDLQTVMAAQVAAGTTTVPAPKSAAVTSLAAPNPARTFTVNSAADTPDAKQGNGVCADSLGLCTLRAAIMEANWLSGLTKINFNLVGVAPVTIQLGSSLLPNVGSTTSSVYIDGYSQPGSKPNDAARGTNAIPGVEIRGASATSTDWIFYVPGTGNTFRGLQLDNALRGVFMDGANAANNVVVGNWMGVNRDGSLPARGADGVFFNNGAHNNVVGTSDLADRNVIGNYDKAVYSYGPGTNGNVVQNNMLCMKPDGSTAICQTGVDFDFGPKNALIGGTNPNENNVVGPTCCNSVELSHGWDPAGIDTSSKWQISGNRIVGNWLGFKADGSYDPAYRSAQSVPTFDNGQAVNVYDGSPNNIVQGNYIASVYDGITVGSLNTTGDLIQGNIIGTSPLGQPAPLSGWGAYLRWDTDVHTLIGNHISNAATGGIGLIEPNVTRVTISQNIVDSTGGPAIYFAPDPSDPGHGANDLQAPPTFAATPASISGSSLPNATVEIYRSSGTLGQPGLPLAYLGSTVANGSGAWSTTLAVANGDALTALQTRTDGTSSTLSPTVIVSDAQTPPTASFTWLQSTQSMSVAFTDTSTGQPTSWSWDFGDGAHSVLQSPSHLYSGSGDYVVVLTATNASGSTQSTQTIHVNAVATVYAADGFGRQVTGGWTTADVGGSYTLFGDTSNYNVGGGTGQMVLTKASTTRSAILGSVAAGDVDMKVRFAVDKLPTGGAQYAYLIARSVGNSSYRPKLILNSNGTAAVHAGVVNNGTETSLGNAVTVAGLAPAAGTFMWLRAQITGTNPTTIKVRAWRDGDPEPSTWQFTATNSLGSLQGTGGVGLASYIGSGTSNMPVTFAFEDFLAVDPNGGTVVNPTSSFTYAQETNSLVVDFTDRSTGQPTSWLWDFGDNTSSTQRNPTHTYATAGAYQVSLTVSNSSGSSSATQTVSVAAPVAITYAQDSFTRTVAGGWGTADTGGAYTAAGAAAALNVGSGVGVIAPPRAGATRGVTLDSVSARDVNILVRVAVDKRPTGGIVWAYEIARHNGNNEYRPKILFNPNGTIQVHAGLVINDAESPIGSPVTVPGLTYNAGTFIWLRAQITGSNPTTIKVRAWADGQSEPTTWQFTGTDSTSVLQSAGSVGLRVYTNTTVTNAPVSVSFDDYFVGDPNGGSGVTTSATLVGAGDIARCDSTADDDTAALAAAISGTVFTAGDNVYPSGTSQSYSDCYTPSWGALLSRTRAVPGNHEFETDSTAAPYFAYFGAHAGPTKSGYYAFEAGAWRVYMLNSECSSNGSCLSQLDWLRADLAAAPHQCVAAIWHRPRFSTGEHGDNADMGTLYSTLYQAGAEVLLAGHDHVYERFAPVNASGVADPSSGIREFVVGTGGGSLDTAPGTRSTLEAQSSGVYGVLRLDLAPGTYSWQFKSARGASFTDTGSGVCH